jgi:hypothetical protein
MADMVVRSLHRPQLPHRELLGCMSHFGSHSAQALVAMFVEGCVLFAILGQYSQATGRLFDPDPMIQGWRLSPYWCVA